MQTSIGLIMLAGGDAGPHPVVQAMRRVRQACAHDMLSRALAADVFEPIIVATADEDWTAALADLPISIEPDAPGDFHFGRRLAALIQQYDLPRVLYVGAAAAPLLTTEDYARIAAELSRHERAIIANNRFSTDWAGITPAAEVARWVDRLGADNALGWVLSTEAGLAAITWPSSPASRLDVDVPVDAQIAALHPACGQHLRRVVADLNWDDSRLRAAQRVFATKASRVILAGRVPSWAWAQLEKSTQCWTRVYSEERGMRAAGRLGAGQVRSLLNDHVQAVGLPQLMADLGAMADVMLWDTRVMWAANGRWPGEIDRYAADLGRVEWIEDEFVRALTQAVNTAPLPIVTGGHALVSGGLWALLETMGNEQ